MTVTYHVSTKEWRDYKNRIYIVLGLATFSLLSGIIGYVIIEGYSVLEAFYMTVITISTVGFEEVKPLSNAGRLFTALFIISNIGIFTYAISVLSSFILDGNIRYLIQHRSMRNKIKDLENHVIICGFGRHGKEVIQQLNTQNEDYVVIEHDSQLIHELEKKNILHVHGSATEDESLHDAGIDRARLLLTTLNSDSENVYLSLTARQLNPNIRIISRGLDESSVGKLKRAGADEVVLSERIGGIYMATIGGQPGVTDFFNLIASDEVANISFENISFDWLDEHTINSLDIKNQTGVNIIGIQNPNGEYMINPDVNLVLKKGMQLIVLGDPKQMNELHKLLATYAI